nr:MFS transporter [Sulfitobacter algicola]
MIAQLPADFADWLDVVAIGALLTFTWSADPIVFAFLAVALGLPYVIVGPFAGVLIDQSSLKTVLIFSNLGRAIMTASLALAPNWQILLILVFIRSAVDAFFTPAKQSAIQATTTPNERMVANGFSHAINQTSKIVAPALGGALLIVFAPSQVFLLNAVVSLVTVSILIGLKPIIRQGIEITDTGSLFAGLRDGWQEISGKPLLRGALILMAGGYFGMFFYDTLIAPLTRDLGFDQTDLGLALSAVGAGGVIGAIYFGMSVTTRRPFGLVSLASAIAGVLVTGLGISEMLKTEVLFPIFLIVFFFLGLTSAMSVVPIRTIIQTETRQDHMARVTALSEAANTTALLTAPFLGAIIASWLSIGAAFVTGGLLLTLVGLYAASLQWRTGKFG